MMNNVCLALGQFSDLWKPQANETTKCLRIEVMRMKLQCVRKISERDSHTMMPYFPTSFNTKNTYTNNKCNDNKIHISKNQVKLSPVKYKFRYFLSANQTYSKLLKDSECRVKHGKPRAYKIILDVNIKDNYD